MHRKPQQRHQNRTQHAILCNLNSFKKNHFKITINNKGNLYASGHFGILLQEQHANSTCIQVSTPSSSTTMWGKNPT